DRYLPQNRGDAAVVHYTNSKPWFRFASRELVSKDDRSRARRDERQYSISFGMWHDSYHRLAGDRIRAAHSALMAEHLDALAGSRSGTDAVLIGNGPSLSRTNLELLSDRVSVAFNWFVNHDGFDDIAVDHLMVMSHMFFGGWHTVEPAFPDGFLESLAARSHRPTLWFPFYFRHLIDGTPELDGYDVRYLLLEKPFKSFVEELGYLKTDLRDFLSDGRTGVLTAGFPLALHLGCSSVALVGCDASYGRADGGDYFYADAAHTSRSTETGSLHSAWADGGAAHLCYAAALREAESRGVEFVDATVEGYLEALPKVEIAGLRR
ncbi:MAG: hypothetical protein P8O03_02235, partial [Ilumatobacter sp.]|nr:hypothetical protein [Ilumatobacter sp.]